GEVEGGGGGGWAGGVVLVAEDGPGELVEPELFRAPELDDPAQRLVHGDIGQCSGDVVCGLRLDEHRRQTNRFLVVGARIGDAADDSNCDARRIVYGTAPFTVSSWAAFAGSTRCPGVVRYRRPTARRDA